MSTLVVCGSEHTACLTSLGDVFTWGKGSHGQLGIGTTDSQISPQLLSLPVDSYSQPDLLEAVDLSCGEDFTGIATSKVSFDT